MSVSFSTVSKEVAFACCSYYPIDEWSSLFSPFSLRRKSSTAYCTDYDNTTKWIYIYMWKTELTNREREIAEGKYVLLLVEVTVILEEEKISADRNALVMKTKNKETINKIGTRWLIY